MILDVERMDEAPSEERQVRTKYDSHILAVDLVLIALLPIQAKIESSAEYLYGLIHARYVLTSAGLNAVLEKYYNAEYGRCPRVHCKDQPVLPAAVSDVPHEEAVKVCS